MPGMVYISHPTEFGTLYSLDELKALSDVCHKYDIPLYLDGARLAYALACPENDVRLRDIASLCDVFYIGGTKCGALFGEAVVIPKKGFIPHIFTIIKQHGALLAKGRIAGIQFETLFTNDLYYKIGQNAIDTAGRIKAALAEYGYEFAFNSPTNQIFVRLSREKSEELSEKIEMGFWENIDDSHVIMASIVAYLIPLAGFLIGLAAGYFAAPHFEQMNPELVMAIAALIGTVLAYLFMRIIDPHFSKGRWEPRIVSIEHVES